ncbi:hypothetical protein M8J76_012684 [Diaphorina citri]|nr:hypothetical protein M8J76_012684 [Diaphorina citri]
MKLPTQRTRKKRDRPSIPMKFEQETNDLQPKEVLLAEQYLNPTVEQYAESREKAGERKPLKQRKRKKKDKPRTDKKLKQEINDLQNKEQLAEQYTESRMKAGLEPQTSRKSKNRAKPKTTMKSKLETSDLQNKEDLFAGHYLGPREKIGQLLSDGRVPKQKPQTQSKKKGAKPKITKKSIQDTNDLKFNAKQYTKLEEKTELKPLTQRKCKNRDKPRTDEKFTEINDIQPKEVLLAEQYINPSAEQYAESEKTGQLKLPTQRTRKKRDRPSIPMKFEQETNDLRPKKVLLAEQYLNPTVEQYAESRKKVGLEPQTSRKSRNRAKPKTTMKSKLEAREKIGQLSSDGRGTKLKTQTENKKKTRMKKKRAKPKITKKSMEDTNDIQHKAELYTELGEKTQLKLPTQRKRKKRPKPRTSKKFKSEPCTEPRKKSEKALSEKEIKVKPKTQRKSMKMSKIEIANKCNSIPCERGPGKIVFHKNIPKGSTPHSYLSLQNTQNNRTLFQCTHCISQFLTQTRLLEHFKTKNHTKKLKSKIPHVEHILRRYPTHQWEILYCQYTASEVDANMENINEHPFFILTTKVTQNPIYICISCSKNFCTYARLKQHFKATHHHDNLRCNDYKTWNIFTLGKMTSEILGYSEILQSEYGFTVEEYVYYGGKYNYCRAIFDVRPQLEGNESAQVDQCLDEKENNAEVACSIPPDSTYDGADLSHSDSELKDEAADYSLLCKSKTIDPQPEEEYGIFTDFTTDLGYDGETKTPDSRRADGKMESTDEDFFDQNFTSLENEIILCENEIVSSDFYEQNVAPHESGIIPCENGIVSSNTTHAENVEAQRFVDSGYNDSGVYSAENSEPTYWDNQEAKFCLSWPDHCESKQIDFCENVEITENADNGEPDRSFKLQQTLADSGYSGASEYFETSTEEAECEDKKDEKAPVCFDSPNLEPGNMLKQTTPEVDGKILEQIIPADSKIESTDDDFFDHNFAPHENEIISCENGIVSCENGIVSCENGIAPSNTTHAENTEAQKFVDSGYNDSDVYTAVENDDPTYWDSQDAKFCLSWPDNDGEQIDFRELTENADYDETNFKLKQTLADSGENVDHETDCSFKLEQTLADSRYSGASEYFETSAEDAEYEDKKDEKAPVCFDSPNLELDGNMLKQTTPDVYEFVDERIHSPSNITWSYKAKRNTTTQRKRPTNWNRSNIRNENQANKRARTVPREEEMKVDIRDVVAKEELLDEKHKREKTVTEDEMRVDKREEMAVEEKSFGNKYKREKQMEIVTEECKRTRPVIRFKCDHCEYSSTLKFQLDQHCEFKHAKITSEYKYTSVETKWECRQTEPAIGFKSCEFSPTVKSEFDRHRKYTPSAISKARKYYCHHCTYSSPWRSNVQRHLKVHNAIRPLLKEKFKCHHCRYKTTLRDNIVHHFPRCEEFQKFKQTMNVPCKLEKVRTERENATEANGGNQVKYVLRIKNKVQKNQTEVNGNGQVKTITRIGQQVLENHAETAGNSQVKDVSRFKPKVLENHSVTGNQVTNGLQNHTEVTENQVNHVSKIKNKVLEIQERLKRFGSTLQSRFAEYQLKTEKHNKLAEQLKHCSKKAIQCQSENNVIEQFICANCCFKAGSLEEMTRHMRRFCQLINQEPKLSAASWDSVELTQTQCEVCKSEMNTRVDFIIHMQTHEAALIYMQEIEESDEETNPTLKKKFACDMCSEYSTKFSSNLTHHVYKQHRDVFTFTCDYCQFATKDLSMLNHHMQYIHTLSSTIVYTPCFPQFQQTKS